MSTKQLLPIPMILAGVGWHALIGVISATLNLAAAACWIIASGARTRRLALLISSCRSVTPAESRPRIPGRDRP